MIISQINIVLIALVTVLALIIIYFIFKKDLDPEQVNSEEDIYSISFLKDAIKAQFNEIINQNIAELYLNKKETRKRELQKARINTAIRSCAQGNIGEKEFIKDYIKDLLQSNFGINDTTIGNVIPFSQYNKLSSQDKFEIIYYLYRKENRAQAFEYLNKDYNFDREKRNEYGTYYEIVEEDIDDAYLRMSAPLRYIDKLEIVTQRIYQEVYGFSVADSLRDDESIDGISGGCSGISSEQYNYMEETFHTGATKKAKAYHSLWIFFHGKAIHMSCLIFHSQNDLIRTCRNLYSYNTVGHLTSTNGYKLTYQFDGSRVVVVRPNLTTHWAFFLRKFDSAKQLTIEKLIQNKGNQMILEALKWIVKGCLNTILSGDQNSGKTTCLKALGIFFDQRNPVRTTEPEFELWFNNTYDNLNCLCFRGSEELSIIGSINLQKKTDASIMILGEVNSYELASAYISLCQSGTKSTLCTCHCVSTEDAVDYFRNSIMSTGTFRNEMIAEEQVANSIYIDVHWEKASDGRRYISYINEIIPYPREEEEEPGAALECIAQSLKKLSRKRAFYVRELIVLENNEYVFKNPFSERSIRRIQKNLTEADRSAFMSGFLVN